MKWCFFKKNDFLISLIFVADGCYCNWFTQYLHKHWTRLVWNRPVGLSLPYRLDLMSRRHTETVRYRLCTYGPSCHIARIDLQDIWLIDVACNRSRPFWLPCQLGPLCQPLCERRTQLAWVQNKSCSRRSLWQQVYALHKKGEKNLVGRFVLGNLPFVWWKRLTVAFEMWQWSIFKTVGYSWSTDGLLAYASNHLRYVYKWAFGAT